VDWLELSQPIHIKEATTSPPASLPRRANVADVGFEAGDARRMPAIAHLLATVVAMPRKKVAGNVRGDRIATDRLSPRDSRDTVDLFLREVDAVLLLPPTLMVVSLSVLRGRYLAAVNCTHPS
jgi:hypothetical protein